MSLLIIGVLLIFCLWAQTVFADVWHGAQWLSDPVFAETRAVDFFRKEKVAPPEQTGPQNVHTYFRKEFKLLEKPVKAVLQVTGDDCLRLYLNGEQVFIGPSPAYPFAYPYYTVELPPEEFESVNCLAAHVYYQGLRNRVWVSADNRAGFVVSLKLEFSNGESQWILTDHTWKCLRSSAYTSSKTVGYQTQFLEDIDMRKVPRGWKEVGFDDSQWTSPRVGFQDHNFVASVTPPLQVLKAYPVSCQEIDENRFLFDFGQEIVGSTRIALSGKPGDTIEVLHAEELNEDGTARYSLRANCEYRETVVLSGNEDEIEFFDYKGFRYLEILNVPQRPEVWVEVRHHPFDPKACRFSSSDDLLNGIWDICRNGVRFGSQGVWVDCPTREKGQYLGDAFIASRSHLILTGDGSLSRKALEDFHLSQRICPGIMGVAPASFMQEIAEFSLLWPIWLEHYFKHTGDGYFTCQMLTDAFEKLFGYFGQFATESGLLSNMTEKWIVVDWPANLRDDFDYDYAKTRENSVLNAYYYGSLRAAQRLCEYFGSPAAATYARRAEKLKEAFNTRLFDENKQLYVDAPGSSHSSLHANALPLAMGLVPNQHTKSVLAFIREKRLSCGCFIAPFVIEGCCNAGAADLGISLLRSTDERSWAEMLRHGATCCMEAWGPDQKWNTSWCHPWSSSPIYLIAEKLVGLSPAQPGWLGAYFSPYVPDDIDSFSFHMHIPFGRISVAYSKSGGFLLEVPPHFDVRMSETLKSRVEVRERSDYTLREITENEWAVLKKHGWKDHAGAKLGVWISVAEQVFRIVEGNHVIWETSCSTAAAGTGNLMDSNKTPLGWHSIAAKCGDTEPWGRIFRSGKPTGDLWRPGMTVTEDLVLTRVLFLQGEEPGKNKGGDVDTYRRHIYIHGTNGEELIGNPVSHGCIRLRNSDVIVAYQLIPEKTPVLITP